jgi:hypothetical protein
MTKGGALFPFILDLALTPSRCALGAAYLGWLRSFAILTADVEAQTTPPCSELGGLSKGLLSVFHKFSPAQSPVGQLHSNF